MQETQGPKYKGETMRSAYLVGESFLEELMVELSLEGRMGSGGGTERVVLAERTACTPGLCLGTA